MTIQDLSISLDTVWMLLAAMLVFFMQPGFALCEAGFTRSKNTANILFKNFVDFIKAYFAMGGYHVQFNIVDSNMLRDAQKHPENYRELMVRVAGFSSYWCELGKPIQDEVIARTEYNQL